MSDDTSKTGGADRSRISLGQEHEVAYWTQKFGVSRDELAAAVDRAGPMAEDVERELGRSRS